MTFSETYVYNVYNEIANHFNDTRAYTWKGVEEFIHRLEPYSSLLEIGCGNGKNLLIRYDLIKIGIDISTSMARISSQKSLNIAVATCIRLPFRDNYFKASMSVAVIHHLDTEDGRHTAIKEQIRITESGGSIFIQVWAIDAVNKLKPEKAAKKFKRLEIPGDYLVKWQTLNGNIYHRYYHLFDKDEFRQLIYSHELYLSKITISYEHDNWIAVIVKK